MILILLLCGCAIQEKTVTNNDEVKEVTPTPTPVPEYKDDNPIKVGLYMNGKLVHDYATPIIDAEDIAVYDIYFTNEENVGDYSTKYNFNRFYQEYDNIDKYKIGFYIGFETKDKKKEVTVLDPSKMHDLYYIYNYLYDDIHQPDGAWYSHVEMDDVKDNTLYTSIKLYAGGETDQITSPITLTVFTYDDMDDFDQNGYYRGNSSYTIKISKQ